MTPEECVANLPETHFQALCSIRRRIVYLGIGAWKVPDYLLLQVHRPRLIEVCGNYVLLTDFGRLVADVAIKAMDVRTRMLA